MTKVAYNACYGGFSLSRAAVLRARELSGNPAWGGGILKGELYPDGRSICGWDDVHVNTPRTDPVLIQVIEELGDKASGSCADLQIAEIAAGSKYRIDEYDGNESVETPDSYDWETA